MTAKYVLIEFEMNKDSKLQFQGSSIIRYFQCIGSR